MGNYTIFQMFENKQASKTFYNKCSENSRSQIVFRTDIFRKLTLGAPESKLDGTISDTEVYIPGYIIIRKDRSRSGGGVALYIRENLSYTNRIDLVPDTLEIICVEINLPHSRSFLVSTWYRPPSA